MPRPDHRRAPSATRLAPVVSIVGLIVAGCSPTLDWREFDVEGAGLHVGFPCRPDRSVRDVPVAPSATAPMTMLSCDADGTTFAVGFVEGVDAARAGPLMHAWRQAAARRLGVSDRTPTPVAVPGSSVDPEAGAIEIDGHLYDGRAVHARMLWFSRGRRVYQAAALGPLGGRASAEPFFLALRPVD